MIGKKLGQRDVVVLDSIPMLIICIALVFGLYLSCITGIASNNAMRYMIQIFLFITLGEMWNLLSGFAGMTSLGQQLYIGLAGYSVAVMTTKFHMGLGAGLAVGVLVSTIVALLLSLILFKMQGMYFSISTWVVAEAFATLFLSWKFVEQGSGMTIRVVPYPRIGEICILSLTICVVAMITVYCLLRTKVGLGLTAMRDDITAASAVGVNVFSHKLIVYLIAAVFTTLAGGIFFINKGIIYPENGFGISWTVSMIFIVTIGGTGTVGGPIVGAVIYVFLQEILARYPGWSNIILGIITILVILFLPTGIMGTLQKKLRFEIFSSKRFSFAKHK
ncbi:MAG: branched-chain amino acid ABC transporter permease [Ruminococcus sp.]|nr:branched-chain amino acid ABC transporter permease [Ruminococcus sp.]